jgi:ubiquitin-conjugating enzyme E2 variant
MSSERGEVGWEPATTGDVVTAAVFVALLVPFAYRTAGAIGAGGHTETIGVALLLGVLASDLVTGIVHWLCDTFFAETTRIIGPAVIQPFREHHRDPLAMTRRSFLRVSSSNVVGTSVVLAGVSCWRAVAPSSPSAFFDAWITSFACALWLTNQLHKWAHVDRVPRPVVWLQDAGVILSPTRHARHHAYTQGGAYCVTTGWLNPVLDRGRVFAMIERMIRTAGHVRAPAGRAGPRTAKEPEPPVPRRSS